MELTAEEEVIAFRLCDGWQAISLADKQAVINFAVRLQQSIATRRSGNGNAAPQPSLPSSLCQQEKKL